MIKINRGNLTVIANNYLKELNRKRFNKKKNNVLQNYWVINKDRIIKSNDLNKIINEFQALNQNGLDDFKKYMIGQYEEMFYNQKIGKWLSKQLNVKTCPYCNRQYTFTIEKGSKTIRPEFDHFYSKSEFPYLALSFYNLIPSCSVCNSSVKSTSPFSTTTHLHPYLDKDISEKYTFSYTKDSLNDNIISFANEAYLDIKTKRTLDDIGSKLVYSRHSSKELQDLIDLRYKYSDNYLEILLERTFGDLQISKEERYRLIFGIELDSEYYHKRPFSKFKNDIITELLNNT